ncbi:uncharacterized protein LOC105189079 isoform X2 [Harpegnathos saltator]|uniref:uncharacterized protein LOC105189079 isoform X2 n=1 Tax=Harpegnathos saltator TaxID=610380 RepID=UPI00058AE43F|nr:uncharacterized protein LOC105189079 isoform X2 [Harpegnathos saltator]
MSSQRSKSAESDVGIKIHDTLMAINDITLKIKKELELIEELVKENGHLYTAITTANETLSWKVQKMGLNVEHIMNEVKSKDRLEPNILELPEQTFFVHQSTCMTLMVS